MYEYLRENKKMAGKPIYSQAFSRQVSVWNNLRTSAHTNSIRVLAAYILYVNQLKKEKEGPIRQYRYNFKIIARRK